MAEPKIRRRFKAVPVSLSTSTVSATTLRMDDVAGGALLMGTSVTSASAFTLQLWAAPTGDGPFGRLRDAGGEVADMTLATSTVTPQVYALPDAAYGVGALRIVSDSTNTTAAVAVVMLKT